MESGTRYELTGRVAVSATATVWRANDTSLDRVVAIKALHPELAANPEQRERLREEARQLGAISDEHVVAVYDFVERPDDVWLVEEWVDGATLRRVRDAASRLTSEQAVGVIRGALLGLATVHTRGIVHGDVAPSNVLVTVDGVSKLCDFGVAAPVGSQGVAAGTPAYMSPEAVRGGSLSPASDVYSTGAVLASLLTGDDVFRGPDVDAVLAQHLAERRPALDGVPTALQAVLHLCLAAEPGERPQDAAALLPLLEEAAERDLGAGWLSRAGVASLVGAAVATPGAAAARHVVRGTHRSRSAGHLLTSKPVVAMVAALVVGGTVAVVISRGSGGQADAAPAPTTTAVVATTAAPSPAATTTVPPATTAAAPTTTTPATTVAPKPTSSTITAAGVVSYERSTHLIGDVKEVCVELKTATGRYVLEGSTAAGYSTIASFGFGGVLEPSRTGVGAGTGGSSAGPRWPIGTHVTVTGTVVPFGGGDSGCPKRSALMITHIGK